LNDEDYAAESWKMRTEEEEKKSNLPCAGIILFRFYGYYLSLSVRHPAGGSAPRELMKAGFPPAVQRYVTSDSVQRQIKIMRSNMEMQHPG
jgi:hypothetical protein